MLSRFFPSVDDHAKLVDVIISIMSILPTVISKTIRLSGLFLLGLLLSSASYGAGKVTNSTETSFSVQCPELLREADSFAQECKAHARKLVSHWHAEFQWGGYAPEWTTGIYKAWFKPAKPGSHFSIGCTLNEQNKVVYLGIYYATSSKNFISANTEPLRYIDDHGNVGLWVKNKPVNLIAIRQFDIPAAPRDKSREYEVKNCESKALPPGVLFTYHYFYARSQPGPYEYWICEGEANTCSIEKYTPFFSSDDPTIIHAGVDYIVRSGGDLWVKTKALKKSCASDHKLRDTPDVAQEVCDVKPSQ
jgi:hypothetical protein